METPKGWRTLIEFSSLLAFTSWPGTPSPYDREPNIVGCADYAVRLPETKCMITEMTAKISSR
jgi:hypothetical protein